jgi:hypothetical protein
MWSYGCAIFIRMWHVEKGNWTVFTGRAWNCVLHRDKQLSNAKLQGCYAPDKLGRHLRVAFKFWKCWLGLEVLVGGGGGGGSGKYKQCCCKRCESRWWSVCRLSTVLHVCVYKAISDTHYHRTQACWCTVAPSHSPSPTFLHQPCCHHSVIAHGLRLKCDDTSKNQISSFGETSPFKSAGASVQSTTGSRGVRISGSNAGYTMFRGCVKGTGYPLHLPVSPSLPLLCAITFQLDSTTTWSVLTSLILAITESLLSLIPSIGTKGPSHGLPPHDPRLHLLQATQTWNIFFKAQCTIQLNRIQNFVIKLPYFSIDNAHDANYR